MNQMLELNIKIVKKLRKEVELSTGLDRINNDDMLWIDQFNRQGKITPIRIVR